MWLIPLGSIELASGTTKAASVSSRIALRNSSLSAAASASAFFWATNSLASRCASARASRSRRAHGVSDHSSSVATVTAWLSSPIASCTSPDSCIFAVMLTQPLLQLLRCRFLTPAIDCPVPTVAHLPAGPRPQCPTWPRWLALPRFPLRYPRRSAVLC
jgi:hypothetical protein